jgi:hypothetical protein
MSVSRAASSATWLCVHLRTQTHMKTDRGKCRFQSTIVYRAGVFQEQVGLAASEPRINVLAIFFHAAPWNSRVSLLQISEESVTEFAPHLALQRIA